MSLFIYLGAALVRSGTLLGEQRRYDRTQETIAKGLGLFQLFLYGGGATAVVNNKKINDHITRIQIVPRLRSFCVRQSYQ